MSAAVTKASSSSGTSSSGSSSSSSPSKTLGKDDFLKLMITQMRYQDPLNPSDSTQYVTQLAQFSSLEQMQNLNTTATSLSTDQQVLHGVDLIGKTITGLDSSSKIVTGKVDSVTFASGQTTLGVSGSKIPLENVTSVANGS